MIEGHTCRTCRWWKALPNGKEGECRRHSPSPLTSTKFPRTIYSDWCGEHDAVENEAVGERNAILQDIANSLQKLLDRLDNAWEEKHVVIAEKDDVVDPSAEANYE